MTRHLQDLARITFGPPDIYPTGPHPSAADPHLAAFPLRIVPTRHLPRIACALLGFAAGVAVSLLAMIARASW